MNLQHIYATEATVVRQNTLNDGDDQASAGQVNL